MFQHEKATAQMYYADEGRMLSPQFNYRPLLRTNCFKRHELEEIIKNTAVAYPDYIYIHADWT